MQPCTGNRCSDTNPQRAALSVGLVSRSLLSASLLLSLALMAGRLAGFGRELILAATFGVSAQADVAVVLLTVPDLLVNLLLSGGISVALVPVLRAANDMQAVALFRQASLAVGGAFIVLGFVFTIAPSLWLGLLAPGMDQGLRAVDGWLGYGIGGAIVLTALSGVTTAALNSRDRFFVAGCGTLIFNIAIIVALMLAREGAVLTWLVGGILVGALLRWGSQWAGWHSMRLRAGQSKDWLIDRILMKRFAAGLASASILVLVPVILRGSASWLGSGQLASFNYALKLIELPLGIFITTLATVAFPRLSEAYHQKNSGEFDGLLVATLGRSTLISVAVVICGWPVIDSVVTLLFNTGKLTPHELAHISVLTQIALLGTPWVGMAGVAIAALNAQRRPEFVLRRILTAMLMLPVLCLPGVWGGQPIWLMWAFPVFYILLTVSLFWGGQCFMQRGVMPAARLMIYLIAYFGCIALAGHIFESWLFTDVDQQSYWNMGKRIILAGVMFVTMLGGGLHLLRNDEHCMIKNEED